MADKPSTPVPAGGASNRIIDYWDAVAPALRAEFERTRVAHSDSAVKGGANEATLAAFLHQHAGAHRVARNSTICDRDGAASDEVDVAVVNSDQPIWTGGTNQLLIAEAVETAYQVKAILTHDELRRAIRNARSVKRLLRVLPAGTMAHSNPSDGPRFVDRIPFFIFAYEAKMTADAAMRTLAEELDGVSWDQQPDGVFTLDDWALVNVGDNAGAFKIGPMEQSGFRHAEADRSPLALMLWLHAILPPRFVHFRHPVSQYHPFTQLGDAKPDRPDRGWGGD